MLKQPDSGVNGHDSFEEASDARDSARLERLKEFEAKLRDALNKTEQLRAELKLNMVGDVSLKPNSNGCVRKPSKLAAGWRSDFLVNQTV